MAAFIKLRIDYSHKLELFIERYVCSPVGKYRNVFFYKYLLKIAKDVPVKCIEWSLNFNNQIKSNSQNRLLRNEPIEVIIQAYNAIRKFDDEAADKAMDAFDEILKIPEFRGKAINVLDKLDK